MRILAITSHYPHPGRETVATFNRQQFRALASLHELRVAAPLFWTERFSEALSGKFTPREFTNSDGIRVYHPTYYYIPKILEHRYGQFYLHTVQPTVWRAIEEYRPNVILTCWAHPDGWAATQIARQAGLPVVLKIIGSDVLVVSRKMRRRRRIAETLREVDAVIGVSRHLINSAVGMGADPARAHVVYEGIDANLFSPGDQGAARARLGLPASGRFLLFVGSLLESKGIFVLAEACRRLRERDVRFTAYIIGQGRHESRLRSSIARLGLSDCLLLCGNQVPEQVVDWYRASDVVTLPSFSEGIPNVLREAMMCGKPFVATHVGGIPEIAHPSYSRLVAPGKAAELAEALETVLLAPLAVDGYLVGQRNISWDQSARLLAQHLEEAVDSHTAHHSRPSLEGIDPQDRLNGSRSAAANSNDCLRILAITNQYPRLGRDIIASFNRQQFRALAASHDVRVVAPRLWTEVALDAVRADLRPTRYQNKDGIWVDHPIYFYPPKMLQHLYGGFYLRSVRRRVQKILGEFRPNVLLGCWAHPDGWATVRIARAAGLPVVVKVHGSDVLVTTQNSRRRARIAEALCAADAVVAVSQDLADVVARLGADPSKIHVVHNGIDANLFTPGDQGAARARLGLPAGGRVFLFVGNLLESKGILVLADACGRLRERGVPFTGYVLGQGRHQSRLRSSIARLGLSDCLLLRDTEAPQMLVEWYRASDVVTLPSFSEGIPNVLREAMMCGKPFVATHVGGIPEIAHPSYSRLVAPGDASQLAEALEAMLQAPPAVDAGLVRSINVSWEESASRLAEILRCAVYMHRARQEPSVVTSGW
jgi:glycosyltransferase involved in cell wall biosynthesis